MKEEAADILGYKVNTKNRTIAKKYSAMIKAKENYIDQCGHEFKDKYCLDNEEGAGYPGAPSRVYSNEPLPWQKADCKPAFLFSTMAAKWSSKNAQQMKMSEKTYDYERWHHQQGVHHQWAMWWGGFRTHWQWIE